MRMISRYDPRGGLADFWEVFRQPNPYRWPILAASALITGSLIWLVTHETIYAPPERPTVTYITTFADGRTDAEIAERNAERQQVQDALNRLRAEQAETSRELYRQLGRATGLDVDAMEARIRAEEEAAQRQASQEGNTTANAPR